MPSTAQRAAPELRHPRSLGWLGTTAMAMGGSNASLLVIGAVFAAQGSAAVPLLLVGLVLSWAALPGWTELVLMWPDRVGGIAATCSEAFKPYSPVLANLAGTCYWWGWVPSCGLCALVSASALHQWYLPTVPVTPMAALLVAAFTALNLTGVRRVANVAVVMAAGSALVALASALIPVASGRVDWHRAATFHLSVPFGGVFGHFTSAMAGLYLIGYAAPAFEAAACHVGETRHPDRDVPRAMYATAAVSTLYLVVLPVVWLGMFGPSALTRDLIDFLGPTFAPLFGAGAKAAAVGFIVLNMGQGTLTPVTGVARTLSQLSEDGLLPRSLARRTRRDVPWVASALTAAMAIAFLLGGDPLWVLAASNFTYLIGIALPSVAVWLLRRRQPDWPRPYRAPRGTIGLGLVAAAGWAGATIFGFEQFGLPTVLAGLVLAYSGAAAYWVRRRRDRRGGPAPVQRSLHLKLTGAMLAVLTLDGIGYLLAVDHVAVSDPTLVAGLKDIFVAVAILTVTVGLILPGMIAYAASELVVAADRLATGTLADLTRAMRALASGDLDNASARVDSRHVDIAARDEVSAVASSFNLIIDEAARVAESLDVARDALLAHRRELEDLVEQRTVHAAQQAAIAALGREALAASDAATILDHAVTTVLGAADADRATFAEVDAARGTLDVTRARARVGEVHATPVVASPESGWAAMLAATSPIELDGAARAALVGDPTGTALWTPVSVRREAVGGIVAHRAAGRPAFTSDDRSYLSSVANIVGSALDRLRTEAELNHHALHDPLTGLPNRSLFVDRLSLALARLRRHPGSIAVMFVDVDQFKVINDSLGHDEGDRLLEMIADRLTEAVRPGDTVARFGGDEFVVLCEELEGGAEAFAIAERIRAASSEPLVLDGRDYVVTVSTGIAVTECPTVAPTDLLRDADSAMYHAKASGRARSALFAEPMRARAVRRLDTEVALRRAITDGELRVYYQPIVNLVTGRTDAAEALVRWEDPQRGLVPPGEFIPVAEETGLIVALGEWVLREACRQAMEWRERAPGWDYFGVSVNLSGRQVAQDDLVPLVADVLAETGLPPHRLVLEITESVLMADAEYAIGVLRELKTLGVRMSVDDFGTGYSSLSYLKKFPVNILKIDRSFVDGLGVDGDDSAIVNATVTLAHSLGLTTVAEGTETGDQVRALAALGCNKAQGFLFSPPVPALQFMAQGGPFAHAPLAAGEAVG